MHSDNRVGAMTDETGREAPYTVLSAERILLELRKQEEFPFPNSSITQLDHSLQAATRALRDGADIDWTAGALLHDIGHGLAPKNHDRFFSGSLTTFRSRRGYMGD